MHTAKNTECNLISFDTLVGENSGVAFTHPPPSAIMSHFIIEQRCYFLRYSIGLDCTFACAGTGPLDRVLYLGSNVFNSAEEGPGTEDVVTGTSPESCSGCCGARDISALDTTRSRMLDNLACCRLSLLLAISVHVVIGKLAGSVVAIIWLCPSSRELPETSTDPLGMVDSPDESSPLRLGTGSV